jgi:hypothetical protein
VKKNTRQEKEYEKWQIIKGLNI